MPSLGYQVSARHTESLLFLSRRYRQLLVKSSSGHSDLTGSSVAQCVSGMPSASEFLATVKISFDDVQLRSGAAAHKEQSHGICLVAT